jgi:hypothetical protein
MEEPQEENSVSSPSRKKSDRRMVSTNNPAPYIDYFQNRERKKIALISSVMGILASMMIVIFFWSQNVVEDSVISDTINRDQIEAAIPSLSPETMSGLAEDVRKCHVPLGAIKVKVANGGPVQKLQVVSGEYRSPEVVVTNELQRVPIPFPAPYESGQGSIQLIGNFKNLEVLRFNGTWGAPLASEGLMSMGLRWTVRKPC